MKLKLSDWLSIAVSHILAIIFILLFNMWLFWLILESNPENMMTSYPDLASPTDSVIAGDFGSLSAEEQVS